MQALTLVRNIGLTFAVLGSSLGLGAQAQPTDDSTSCLGAGARDSVRFTLDTASSHLRLDARTNGSTASSQWNIFAIDESPEGLTLESKCKNRKLIISVYSSENDDRITHARINSQYFLLKEYDEDAEAISIELRKPVLLCDIIEEDLEEEEIYTLGRVNIFSQSEEALEGPLGPTSFAIDVDRYDEPTVVEAASTMRTGANTGYLSESFQLTANSDAEGPYLLKDTSIGAGRLYDLECAKP